MLVREETQGCHIVGEGDGGEGVRVPLPHACESVGVSQFEWRGEGGESSRYLSKQEQHRH